MKTVKAQAVEQAVAQGSTASQIMATYGITYRQYRNIIDGMSDSLTTEQERAAELAALMGDRPLESFYGPATAEQIEGLVAAICPPREREIRAQVVHTRCRLCGQPAPRQATRRDTPLTTPLTRRSA